MEQTIVIRVGKETRTYNTTPLGTAFERMDRDLRNACSSKWRGLRPWLRGLLDPNYVHPKKIRRGQ